MISALLTLQSYPVRKGEGRGGGGISILSHRCNSSESGVNQLCYITNIPDFWAPPCKNSSRAAEIGPRSNPLVSRSAWKSPVYVAILLPVSCSCTLSSFVGHHLHPPGPPGAGRACRASVWELRPLSLYSQASHNSLALPLILPLSAV